MDSHPDLIEGQEQPGEEWFEVKDGVGVWMGEGIGTKLEEQKAHSTPSIVATN